MIAALRRNRKTEAGGAGVIVIILLIPAIMLLFGLGVDSSRANYARTTLDNNVESSVIAAASRIDGVSYKIDPVAAKRAFIESYNMILNTEDEVLGCNPREEKIYEGVGELITHRLPNGKTCQWILESWTVNNNISDTNPYPSVTATVVGYSHNIFLRGLGEVGRNFSFKSTHVAYLRNN